MDTSSFHQTMESLQLPKELYWDLKLEPQSPTSAAAASDLFALTEPTDAEWLYDDNFANGISLIGNGEDLTLDEAASLELLSDEELVVEIFDLKDEECLLDQKAPLNCIDYETNSYQPNIDVVSQPIIPVTKVQFPVSSTASLVATAEYQLGDSPSLILQQLTPPQSPPQFDAPQPVLVKAEQKVQCYASDAAPAATFNFNNWVGGSEIAREIQLVDDIVNMRAQELELFNDDCESQASSSLDGSSSSSSSGGSGVSGSIADVDEEWLPEPVNSNSSSPAYTSVEEKKAVVQGPKKRTRTYGRGVEDRKIRKKEQNKNAATRYRQKKKLEMENVLGEEQVLSQENEELRRTLRERRNEMRYLRQLIREFYQERKR